MDNNLTWSQQMALEYPKYMLIEWRGRQYRVLRFDNGDVLTPNYDLPVDEMLTSPPLRIPKGEYEIVFMSDEDKIIRASQARE